MGWQEKLKEEIKALGTAAVYFAAWIAAMLLIKTLILAEYRIAASNWSMIVVGALVLSKEVLILEHVSLGAWVRARPAWVDVLLRTVIYSLGVAILLLLEKGFEERHEYGGFGAALRNLFRQADMYHVWVTIICLSGALLGDNLLSVVRRPWVPAALPGFFACCCHRSRTLPIRKGGRQAPNQAWGATF